MSEEDLTHFGVKGMRWGVRRESTTPSTPKEPTPVIVKTKPNSSKISTKGGANHPATSEAVRAASIAQKLQKSGVNSLTNKEMQDLANRMNLQQQMSKLAPVSKRKKNTDAVLSFLGRNGSQAVNQITKTAMNLAIQQLFAQMKDKKK